MDTLISDIKIQTNFSLRMRFGVTDFAKVAVHHSIERSIAEVLIHPKHRHDTAHYDVGIAVAGENQMLLAPKTPCLLRSIAKTMKKI